MSQSALRKEETDFPGTVFRGTGMDSNEPTFNAVDEITESCLESPLLNSFLKAN